MKLANTNLSPHTPPYSAVVLNVISFSKAYCLYPTASFIQKRSLLQTRYSTHTHARAIRKYTRRGWTMVPYVPHLEAYEPASPFPTGTRFLGDSKCWTINLRPFADAKEDDVIPSISHVSGNIEANRWIATLDRAGYALVNANIFVSDRLEHGYTVSPGLSTAEVIQRMNHLRDSFPDKRLVTQP